VILGVNVAFLVAAADAPALVSYPLVPPPIDLLTPKRLAASILVPLVPLAVATLDLALVVALSLPLIDRGRWFLSFELPTVLALPTALVRPPLKRN